MVTPVANDYIKNYMLKNFNVSVSDYIELYQLQKNGTIPGDELKYLQYTTYESNFDIYLKRSFGYTFFLICIFYNNICQIDDNIFWYYEASNGNCLKFNSNKYANGSTRNVYTVDQFETGLLFVSFIGNLHILSIYN